MQNQINNFINILFALEQADTNETAAQLDAAIDALMQRWNVKFKRYWQLHPQVKDHVIELVHEEGTDHVRNAFFEDINRMDIDANLFADYCVMYMNFEKMNYSVPDVIFSRNKISLAAML